MLTTGKDKRVKENAELWRPGRGKVLRVEFFNAYKRTRHKAWPVVSKCIRVRSRLDHGDSGGPMVNRRGQLIGVVSLSNMRNLVWNIHVVEVKRFLRRVFLRLGHRGRSKATTWRN